jgi:carbon monoxide dehydrogenase subunit G
MRILRNIIGVIVALIIIAIAVAYLLPQKVAVARSTDIAAPPTVVFSLVADLRQSRTWYPWVAMDPDIKIEFSGPDVGVGQKMSWESAKVGNGSQTVTVYEPDTRVQANLDFGAQGTAVATTTVDPKGGGSSVTWGFDTDLGMNPVARYFGLAIERFVAPDYEKGLAKLKEIAEAEAAKPAAPEAPGMSSEPAPALTEPAPNP